MIVECAAFARADAEVIASWIRSDEEADAWASVRREEVSVERFDEWHADPDVHAFVVRSTGRVCGYGEVWADPEEGEAELARIVVDPQWRGRGVGRRLTGLLAAEAARLGFDTVWLRVVPTNEAAIACYSAAGFVRASEAEEHSFNHGQPRVYVWMRHAAG